MLFNVSIWSLASAHLSFPIRNLLLNLQTQSLHARVCVCVRGHAFLTSYLCRPKEIGGDLLRYVTGVSVMDRRDILTIS